MVIRLLLDEGPRNTSQQLLAFNLLSDHLLGH